MNAMNRHLRHIILSILMLSACSPDDRPDDVPEKDPVQVERAFFAKGADISWTTQMEADGVKFYGADGIIRFNWRADGSCSIISICIFTSKRMVIL